MKKFLTIGEPLVVFSSEDLNKNLADAKHFTKYLAGAELNVSIGLARLGINSNYVTAIGPDPLGQFIKNSIQVDGINTDYIYEDEEHSSGFYLKQRVDKGDPDVYYYRKNSAMSHFNPNKLNDVAIDDSVGIIHCTGITAAISDNGYKTVERLLDLGKEHQVKTVFDPNLRIPLWKNEAVMVEKTNELAAKANIFIPGINECKILTGGLEDPEEIAAFYFNQSEITETVIIKDGPRGAFIKSRNEPMDYANGFKVDKVVDTVGAGDGFAVGLISGLLENQSLKSSVTRGCAIGALAVQSVGDSDGYPTRNKLEEFMGSSNNG